MWQNYPNCSVSDDATARNLENADWGDVVRKPDCSVQNPLDVNVYFILFQGFICVVGFPINFEIVYRIVYDKVLLRKSRYVIQLFSTVSNLFTLFTNILQIVYFIFRKNKELSQKLCHIYVSIFALSYGVFFLNLLASLIDSFVSTNFSILHKKKFTRRRVIYCLSFANLALIVVMKWVFISQIVPVHCAIQPIHAKNIQFTIVPLFISSIFSLIVNFVFILRLLRRASRINQTPNRRRQKPEEIQLRERLPRNRRSVSFALAVIDDRESTGDENGPSPTLIQLKLETTKMFLFTIIPLILLHLPVLILLIPCFNSSHPADYCHDITWLIPYLPAVIGSLNTLVSPIMSLMLNKDFAPRCALRQLIMYFIISFCSFHASFFFIVSFVFIFNRIPQSLSAALAQR